MYLKITDSKDVHTGCMIVTFETTLEKNPGLSFLAILSLEEVGQLLGGG